jgi:hypothetical protein
MKNTSRVDPVSQSLEKEVSYLQPLNDDRYYNILEKIDLTLLPITKKKLITPYLTRYRQQQIGKYGVYNWYFRLWGLSKPLQPDKVLAKGIVLFGISLIIGLLCSIFSTALFILIVLGGYIIAKKTISAPANTLYSLRHMTLMYYPQTASIFAARNIADVIEILQDVEIIGHEVKNLLALQLKSPNPNTPTTEALLADYFNKHPLNSMSLLKDVIDSFKIVNIDVRRATRTQIMKQFPLELDEYFDLITNEYREIQKICLAFSEAIVFAIFMVLAIFDLIDTPLALIFPALVIIVADTFLPTMIFRNASAKLFYDANIGELEKNLRKTNWKIAYPFGFIVSTIFAISVGDPMLGIMSVVVGTLMLGYMFSSIFAVIQSELEHPAIQLHELIREHMNIISSMRKEVGEVSMLYAFKHGIGQNYNGQLRNKIKPIIASLQLNASIHDVLDNIYNNVYGQSSVLRPYLFFIERIIDASPVKGKKTETNPSELLDVIYEISSQILRRLASKYEAILVTGSSRANFTGVINGMTTGIFVILGKIFKNVLMNGLGNMGNILTPSTGGDMGSWLFDFILGMVGTLGGYELIAAMTLSLAGTYLGAYIFQSKRTGAYAFSVLSALLCTYFGFALMNKIVNMMVNFV